MVERKKEMGRDRVSRLISWGHWFAFFNGFLAMIVGFRYLDTVGYPETWIGWGYLAISTIGHFSFLSFIVYLVLIFPVTLLLPYSKILRGYAASVATLGLCLLLYDTIIYDDYGLHLSPFVFDLAWADLHSLLHGTSYIITPLCIIIIELSAANFLWKRIDKIHKAKCGNKVVAFVGICFVSSHLIHIWADAASVKEITRLDDAYPLSYPATARSFMESHGIDSEEIQSRNLSPKSNLSYPITPLQCVSEVQPNILLITIDSLRADMLDESTMPFLNQYAKENLDFHQHLSGGTQLTSGLFSIMYGLQGSYINDMTLAGTAPLLTQILKQQHYQTAVFATDDIELEPKAIFKGLEHHISHVENSHATADKESIANFEQWSAKTQAPWFSLLNLRSPESYDTPVGFLGIETVRPKKTLKSAERVLFNQYRQSLHFIDQELSKLIQNLPQDTLVIITGVSGKVFTSNPDEVRSNMSPDNIHVPLIIHWSGKVPPKDVNFRTSHYGIAPTLLSQVLGCTNAPTDYSAGRSLLQPDSESWIYVGDNLIFGIYQDSEITVIDRHGKYRIYDENYEHRLRKKMSAPELIEVMREGRRLYNH
ncbi:MAG: membrane-anchored protein YejM (alkaline phosphatase superfamily) [Shewanella sp.]|jgi:membrane-anchored protein YejM (alkaline phosphatase superfamily)